MAKYRYTVRQKQRLYTPGKSYNYWIYKNGRQFDGPYTTRKEAQKKATKLNQLGSGVG